MPRNKDPEPNPRLLVVEDSEQARLRLKSLLEGGPLYAEVLEATNGAAGVQIALSDDLLDCVITDLEMPVMGGIGLLRTVRAKKNRLELPVLLLTVADETERKVEGFANGASDFVTKPFDGAELVARVQSQVSLARLNREVERMAKTDWLTGLPNRRRFIEVCVAELFRAERHRHGVGLALVDIDHFKTVNDRHGHPAGDQVLGDFAELLRSTHRIYDHIGRLGGEEFGLLLPEVGAHEAHLVADRVRETIARTAFGGLPPGAVTASIGLCHVVGGEATFEEAYARADQQLYRAKREGRNRVCSEPPSRPG